MVYETAIFQWEEGERRLAGDPNRIRLERVVDEVVAELRRRLGSSFTAQELADLYYAGTDWVLELVTAVAPNQPELWNGTVVVDAAFARYVREAIDFFGGARHH